eukprot:IDg5464t1
MPVSFVQRKCTMPQITLLSLKSVSGRPCCPCPSTTCPEAQLISALVVTLTIIRTLQCARTLNVALREIQRCTSWPGVAASRHATASCPDDRTRWGSITISATATRTGKLLDRGGSRQHTQTAHSQRGARPGCVLNIAAHARCCERRASCNHCRRNGRQANGRQADGGRHSTVCTRSATAPVAQARPVHTTRTTAVAHAHALPLNSYFTRMQPPILPTVQQCPCAVGGTNMRLSYTAARSASRAHAHAPFSISLCSRRSCSQARRTQE